MKEENKNITKQANLKQQTIQQSTPIPTHSKIKAKIL